MTLFDRQSSPLLQYGPNLIIFVLANSYLGTGFATISQLCSGRCQICATAMKDLRNRRAGFVLELVNDERIQVMY